MPQFSPPYPFFFFPPITQSGAPVIADRPDFNPGSHFVHLHSNPTAPSSAAVLRSFGVQSQPVDSSGRLLTGPSRLFISTSIRIRVPFFETSGVLASARTSAIFTYFIEEFDASFRFVRGLTMPGSLVVVSQDFWWFSGSESFTPVASGPGLGISNPPTGALTATPRFFYRVWIDMNADIRAMGFGGLGGSSSFAQLEWDLNWISLRFL